MFCQLDYLRRCTPRTKDIRRALDGLPKTLDDTYARTLERIDEQKWEDAHRIFQCVAVASRPLRVDELAQFLSFDYEAEPTPTFQDDWHPEDPAHTVLSMCSSLLVIVKPEDYESPIVQFAHFSAQEYLMSTRLAEAKDTISRFHVSTTPAHTLVAQACLGLLLHLDETVTKESLENFPLAEYAAEYWVGHARIEDVSSKVQDGMKRLFDPGKIHFSVWVWIYDPECHEYGWNQLGPERSGRSEHPGKARATPLQYAAFCDLHDITKFLIVEHSQDVNARGFKHKETPLHLASRRGHADIARLLLEHGADGNAQNDDGSTPLLLSSSQGHAEVARIVLEQGADTETRNHADWSPLMLVLMEGHVEVVRLLLKHNADENALNKWDWTPLHVASGFGCAGGARLLLERGVDANARNADQSTPLHLASSSSFRLEERLDVVRLLVQYGSDINARDDKGRTPFMVATEKGEDYEMIQPIMQVLLECGAEDHRK